MNVVLRESWGKAAYSVLAFVLMGVGISVGLRITDEILGPRIGVIFIENYVCDEETDANAD